MTARDLTLVTGATGNQGGAVIDALRERSAPVRAVTRDPDGPRAQQLRQQGVQVMRADFDDSTSLHSALEGVSAAFVVTTPYESGIEAEIRHGQQLIDAAKRAGVRHVVYTSVASADQDTRIPHFDSKLKVERWLERADVPYTIVAPVYFMENLLTPAVADELRRGRLVTPLSPGRPLQQVAAQDIGRFVALVLETRDDFLGKRIELASDEIDTAEMARILDRVTGRTFEYTRLPMEELRAQSSEMAAMYQWFERAGYDVPIGSLQRGYPSVGWHTFETWAREQDWSFLDRTD